MGMTVCARAIAETDERANTRRHVTASSRARPQAARPPSLLHCRIRSFDCYSNSSRQRRSTPRLPRVEDETSLMLSYEPCTLKRLFRRHSMLDRSSRSSARPAEDRELRSNIEWRLNNRLSVQGSYDNINDVSSSTLGNLGVDLRWRLEFE